MCTTAKLLVSDMDKTLPEEGEGRTGGGEMEVRTAL